MYIYYLSGIPYSGELYHHGVKNQKWGLRRYQNEDGSLTDLGRVHYGVGPAREAVGNVVKKTGKAVGGALKKTGKAIGNSVKKAHEKRVKEYKRNHPKSMTDEELAEYTDRLAREKRYIDLKKQVDGDSRGKKFVDKALDKAGDAVIDIAIGKAKDSIRLKQELKATKEKRKQQRKFDRKEDEYKRNKYLREREADDAYKLENDKKYKREISKLDYINNERNRNNTSKIENANSVLRKQRENIEKNYSSWDTKKAADELDNYEKLRKIYGFGGGGKKK